LVPKIFSSSLILQIFE
jgi:hypothetical protein